MKRAPHRLDSDILGTYLDAAGSHDLLDAEAERDLARQLWTLRADRWRAAIAAPDAARALVAVAREQGNDAIARAVSVGLAGRRGPSTVVKRLLAADPGSRVLERFELAHARDGSPWASAVQDARRRYLAVRDRFLCANLRLVVSVARGIGHRYMPLIDRIQEGNFGLLAAIERFDPERGCRFSTYAAYWIRYAVTRAVMKDGRTVRIPVHLHTLFTKVRHARAAMDYELGRPPTSSEIAARVDAPVAKIEAAIAAMELHTVGLDEPVARDRGLTIGDLLKDEATDEWSERIGERIDARLADALVDDTLAGLDHEVIEHRFGLHGAAELTLGALGRQHGLSHETIRLRQVAALRRLRAAVDASAVPSLAVA